MRTLIPFSLLVLLVVVCSLVVQPATVHSFPGPTNACQGDRIFFSAEKEGGYPAQAVGPSKSWVVGYTWYQEGTTKHHYTFVLPPLHYLILEKHWYADAYNSCGTDKQWALALAEMWEYNLARLGVTPQRVILPEDSANFPLLKELKTPSWATLPWSAPTQVGGYGVTVFGPESKWILGETWDATSEGTIRSFVFVLPSSNTLYLLGHWGGSAWPLSVTTEAEATAIANRHADELAARSGTRPTVVILPKDKANFPLLWEIDSPYRVYLPLTLR